MVEWVIAGTGAFVVYKATPSIVNAFQVWTQMRLARAARATDAALAADYMAQVEADDNAKMVPIIRERNQELAELIHREEVARQAARTIAAEANTEIVKQYVAKAIESGEGKLVALPPAPTAKDSSFRVARGLLESPPWSQSQPGLGGLGMSQQGAGIMAMLAQRNVHPVASTSADYEQ
jgi:hypothetical protein